MKTFHITYIIQEEPFLTSGINIDASDILCACCDFHNKKSLPSMDKIISIVDKSIFTFNTQQNENNTNKRTA